MLLSILKCKCPRCRKGNLFINPNPFNISTLSKMPKNCEVCGQPTEPEPGFYFGAMYVSYAIGVAMFAILFVLVEFILKVGGYHFMWIYAMVMLILWPVIFRASRVLYIYTFVKYNANASLLSQSNIQKK